MAGQSTDSILCSALTRNSEIAESATGPIAFGTSEYALHPPSTLRTTSPTSASSSATPVATPLTPNSALADGDNGPGDLHMYVAIGCLRCDRTIPLPAPSNEAHLEWIELIFSDLPDEVKAIIGVEAAKLLQAKWIRLFLHNGPELHPETPTSIVRVYILPEDWGRRSVDRHSRVLKSHVRTLLGKLDISEEAWYGDPTTEARYFDPWAASENVSLYYLFNKLPSPAPCAELINNRYSRNAVMGLLEAAAPYSYDDTEYHPIPGLSTRLYPYQARSAALMVQREAAPQLQLDPRLEVRQSPTGEKFYFGPRDGSVLRQQRFYETNRGGILAETMGLGKTIICLAVILATKGHMPQIPPAYLPSPPVRPRVGSLAEMAAHTIGRRSIPGKAYLQHIEASEGYDLRYCKELLAKTVTHYEIPAEPLRMNRNTPFPPPTRLALCGGTIIVVPRNLLHQWQSEIKKHLAKDSLKILVMDSKPKRAPKAKAVPHDDTMDFRSEIPAPAKLMKYNVILFTRNRFEEEIRDSTNETGWRPGSRQPCQCTWVDVEMEDCMCKQDGIYRSPLKQLHWLRIIIDEGQNFSSESSNAVRVAQQLHVERRWIVSGTPAKNLVGVELDLLAHDYGDADASALRELTLEQRKTFTLDKENQKAAQALGALASNFLKVRPWCDLGGKKWEDYIYRHEHEREKTNTGFTTCFLRTLEGLVIKTRPEDVEKDIILPPMRHRTVFLKPCWYDKMTANLFIQVLRANAITSERSDVDYLFHKNSVQARHSLIRNLRQSNFAWTGFSADDVLATLETSKKYLSKEDKACSLEDERLLLESWAIVRSLLDSKGWLGLSNAHEIGLAVHDWPKDCEEYFAVARSEEVATIGITQLLEGQSHVDRQILLENPAEGLDSVGKAGMAKLAALQEAEKKSRKSERKSGEEGLAKAAVPPSCVGGQPLTSRRTSILPLLPAKKAPKKSTTPVKFGATQKGRALQQSPSSVPTPLSHSADTESTGASILHNLPTQIVGLEGVQPGASSKASTPELCITTTSTPRPRKRKITLEDEKAQLPPDSPLLKTCIVGTTSAKITYLLDMVTKYQATDKIIIFYDGDNAAYYLAQCLEILYINHRIYARTLDNTKRSEYVALFNEDPSVRVLLIDVACGALGLNLNAASIVLIVNPINRPGIEAQAIKRAHRIGQTKEVLVETLVLEGTIEEAIFKRAKDMSRGEHQEARTLEDDGKITSIIQNAGVLPIEPGEDVGLRQFALLARPQRVFGREGRENYYRFGNTEEVKEKPESSRKRPRTAAKRKNGRGKASATASVTATATLQQVLGVQDDALAGPANSLFGSGTALP